jgi:hypothetical protein
LAVFMRSVNSRSCPATSFMFIAPTRAHTALVGQPRHSIPAAHPIGWCGTPRRLRGAAGWSWRGPQCS